MNDNAKYQMFLKIVLWFAPVLIGLGLAFGAYRERMSTMETRLSATEIQSTANELSIAILTKDIIYIKETVNRIEKKVDQQNSK